MANLKALSQRIKSVKSIQKTTRVMQMISASKFRAARTSLAYAREYYEKLSADLNVQSPKRSIDDAKPSASELFVIFSSDRGLCGGFNYSIAKAFFEHLNTERNVAGVRQEFLFIGTKVYDIVRSKMGDLEKSAVIRVVPQAKSVNFSGFKDFLQQLSIDFMTFRRVSVLYTRFNTISSQEQVVEDILLNDYKASDEECFPDSRPADARAEVESSCIYDPSFLEISEEVWVKKFFGKFYLAACESMVCEHCSRMIAMESANSNTGSMLDRLVLSYNRSRQAAITTDLIEVISGCEALG